MRVPFKVFATARIALAILILLGSVVLISAPKPPFTAQDKAFYADPNLVNFVRPGLQFRIVSAEIAADGTMRARVRVTDPRGLGLDRLGVNTPGNVSMSFVMAYLPSADSKYVAYTTRQQTSPITRVTATQAAGENNGQFQQTAEGEYTYTFSAKAPATINRNAIHSVLVYGNRNLSEFDLGTNYDDDVFHFIPAGGQVNTAQVRDVIKTESCNKCHFQLAGHGGSRRSLEGCILCHTPQTTDPDTGHTVDMVVMAHKIHAGEALPSVEAGGKYEIIGNQQSVHDYSTVVFPADIRSCQSCHEQRTATGQTPAQANAWLTRPSRAACGSCHDNVNFATGENHANLPQVSDSQCSNCHTPQGELPLDISIMNAHMIPEKTVPREGLELEILSVTNTAPGQRPTVTFTAKRSNGQPYTMAEFPTGTLNRLALVMAGPAHDYGYTSFGSDVTTPGYVSEDPVPRATCAADGVCTYQFQHAIPADAVGTYSMGIEGRRDFTILPGTTREVHTEYGAINKVRYFGVGNSPTDVRRQIVTTAKCNQCHGFLSLHGENRNQVEHCTACHNASETDVRRRPTATVQAERSKPAEPVDFATMIHKIHTGERMHEFGRTYTVIGFGGTAHPFDEVRYPVLTPNGQAADTSVCSMCHVNGSENLPLPDEINRKRVVDPAGFINPAGRVTAACLGCHMSRQAASHALANTTQLGESCSACHGTDAEFSVQRSHAR